MPLIDTHCHLDFEVFDAEREGLVKRCLAMGVTAFILPGVYRNGWDRLSEIGRSSGCFYIAPGLHPCFTEVHDEQDLEALRSLINSGAKKIVAIGEVGLDYFDKSADREKQQHFFKAQVDIAAEHDLPLILHVRKAHDEVLKSIRTSNHSSGGVVHCYSGSLQQAERYLELGFKLGIGGVITYENARRLQAIVKSLSLEAFVLETDAPDIPPAGIQGEYNTPETLPDVFDAFCHFREEPRGELEQALYGNTLDLFPGLEA